MDFRQARIAMDIFEKYSCGKPSTVRKEAGQMLTGCLEFGNDQCWINMYQTTDSPDLTTEELAALDDAEWFYDEEREAWAHF